MRLLVFALGPPELVFQPLAFTTKGQEQYHLEWCMVRAESLSLRGECTRKPRKNDA